MPDPQSAHGQGHPSNHPAPPPPPPPPATTTTTASASAGTTPGPLDGLSPTDLRIKLEHARKNLRNQLDKKRKIDRDLVRPPPFPLLLLLLRCTHALARARAHRPRSSSPSTLSRGRTSQTPSSPHRAPPTPRAAAAARRAPSSATSSAATTRTSRRPRAAQETVARSAGRETDPTTRSACSAPAARRTTA